MARPIKLTPKIFADLQKYLSTGNTRRDSCALSGISEDALARYLKKAPKGFEDFADAIARAEAQAVQRCVTAIQKAANPTDEKFDWRAAAWFLERKRPDDWKLKTEVDLSKLDDETLLRLLSKAEERGDPSRPNRT